MLYLHGCINSMLIKILLNFATFNPYDSYENNISTAFGLNC